MRDIIQEQYKEILETARRCTQELISAPEGWIRTTRKALHMSGAQLARRADVTRSRISQAESAELDGSMSLKQLSRLAESMECKLVYAIVPKTSVDEILEERAKERAFKIVRNASVHMSLESQALPKTMLTLEIERLKQEMLSSPDHNLWND